MNKASPKNNVQIWFTDLECCWCILRTASTCCNSMFNVWRNYHIICIATPISHSYLKCTRHILCWTLQIVSLCLFFFFLTTILITIWSDNCVLLFQNDKYYWADCWCIYWLFINLWEFPNYLTNVLVASFFTNFISFYLMFMIALLTCVSVHNVYT